MAIELPVWAIDILMRIHAAVLHLSNCMFDSTFDEDFEGRFEDEQNIVDSFREWTFCDENVLFLRIFSYLLLLNKIKDELTSMFESTLDENCDGNFVGEHNIMDSSFEWTSCDENVFFPVNIFLCTLCLWTVKQVFIWLNKVTDGFMQKTNQYWMLLVVTSINLF